MFEEGSVPAGECLANRMGSVHQSFTKGDGCVILVLWSGCHLNIKPDQCEGVNPLLRPGAGWT